MRQTQGFSVIEMIVAIFVLSLALTGITTLVQQSLRVGADFKDTLTAGMFAQEGVEFVRARRDSNRLSGLDWMNGLLPAPCGGVNGCTARIDPTNGSLSFLACPAICEPLRFNPASGVYSYAPGALPTSFVRKIQIMEVDPLDGIPEVKVTVLVTFPGLFQNTKSIVLEEWLLDWQ